jgi:ferredoxin
VRRFNWFDYSHGDPIANLALNPDVTVRSRGVMEKCTFCVQRIEEVKIKARNEGRAINDNEIQPACQQSCPANAIIFGDLTDLKSRVARLKKSGRNYTLLDELNLRPALSYLAKVRNFINLQLSIINFVHKYKGVWDKKNEMACVREPGLPYLTRQECFQLTIDAKMEYGPDHPFYDDDSFFYHLLEFYKSREDYEKCDEIVKKRF